MTDMEIKVAKLEANYNHIKEGVQRVEIHVKKNSDKLDTIAEEWRKFGGLYTHLESQNKRINKQDGRIENLESFKGKMEKIGLKMVGGFIVVGGAVVFIWNFIEDWVKAKLLK